MEEYKAKYAIHEACREGHTQKVESLISASPKLATLSDPDSRLPLHWAASYAHLPILHILASLSSFDPDAVDGSGWTALMMASSRREADGLEIVKFLLQRGADPNCKTNTGQTALHFASSKGALDIVRLLLSSSPSASARLRDARGQLALHRAAATGSVPILRALLDARSPIDVVDKEGMSAVVHAVAEGRGDAAVFLIERGAKVDGRDEEGRGVLDYAPDGGTREFVRWGAEREGIEL